MNQWLIEETLLIVKKFLKMKIQIIDIVGKIIGFNKQQNVRGLKILPIALAQAKAVNKSESLLIEIR